MNQFTYSRPPPRRTRCHLRYAFGSFLHHPSAATRHCRPLQFTALHLLFPVPRFRLRFCYACSTSVDITPEQPPRDSHSERACDARSSHTSHVATRFTLGPPRTSEGFLPLHHACIILCRHDEQFGASIMPTCSPTRRCCCRRRGALHCPRRRPLHRPLPCEAHSRSVFACLRRRDSHDSR